MNDRELRNLITQLDQLDFSVNDQEFDEIAKMLSKRKKRKIAPMLWLSGLIILLFGLSYHFTKYTESKVRKKNGLVQAEISVEEKTSPHSPDKPGQEIGPPNQEHSLPHKIPSKAVQHKIRLQSTRHNPRMPSRLQPPVERLRFASKPIRSGLLSKIPKKDFRIDNKYIIQHDLIDHIPAPKSTWRGVIELAGGVSFLAINPNTTDHLHFLTEDATIGQPYQFRFAMGLENDRKISTQILLSYHLNYYNIVLPYLEPALGEYAVIFEDGDQYLAYPDHRRREIQFNTPISSIGFESNWSIRYHSSIRFKLGGGIVVPLESADLQTIKPLSALKFQFDVKLREGAQGTWTLNPQLVYQHSLGKSVLKWQTWQTNLGIGFQF